MAESESHKRAKNKAAGKKGETEVPLPGGGRLDAKTEKTATEVERSGSNAGLKKAAQRLKDSGKPRRVLVVPQKDMPKAAKAMQEIRTSGTVKNMGGTKSQFVPKKPKR